MQHGRLATNIANPRPIEIGETYQGSIKKLGLDVGFTERGVGTDVVDRLLARPALGVHARVHHQPHGAPHLRRQRAEPAVAIGVQPEIAAEPPIVWSGTTSHGKFVPTGGSITKS